MLALVEIPDHVWGAVAEVAERSAEDLRAACIAGGHVSYHFFCRRVLEPAGELPWKLVRGDTAENLRELASGPMPEEPVSQQMWKLLQLGFSSRQLESVLELMADAPWSTLPAEQQHGSLAVLRRWHPEYSTTTLSARALLLQLRRLLPTVSEDERQMARLSCKLNRALSRNPDKSHGRSEFLSELFTHLRSRSCSHSTREVPADMRIKIFKHHAKSWARCSLLEQRHFELLARGRSSAARESLSQEVDEIRGQRALLAGRIEEAADRSRPIVMSECTLLERHLELFGNLLDGGDFRPAEVRRLRDEALVAPPPSTKAVADALASHKVWKRVAPQMPAWARSVAAHREDFKDSVLLVVRGPNEYEFWKMVYAVQMPMYLTLSRLRLSDDFVSVNLDAVDPSAASPCEQYVFRCNFADSCSAADVPLVQEAQLFVIPHARHTSERLLASMCHAVPFRIFLGQLPQTRAREPVEKAAKLDRHREDLIQQFPWLAELDERDGVCEGCGGRGGALS